MDFSRIDETTLNFPGWEYVSLILGLIFLAASLIFLFLFLKTYRKRMFSYVTVGRLGIAMFFFVLSFYRLRYFFAYGSTGTFALMIVHFVFSARSFVMIVSPLMSLLAVALIVSNVLLIKNEGFSRPNLYAFLIAAVILITDAAIIIIETHPLELMMPNALKNIWYCLYCYFACLFFAVQICTVIAANNNPDYDRDYVLILGCKVRSDGTLYPVIKSRVDRAITFVKNQENETGKKAIFLPTGGKGSDECISEAEAMKKYLLENGIDEDRIVIEKESTTTRENMLFSKALIPDNAKAAFSTNGFHVFRSGMLASKLGWEIEGMGGRTAQYYWPNAQMREFIGLLASSWKGQIAAVAAVSAVAGLLTTLI